MNKQVIVLYKSVTGFTRQYADWISEELNCASQELDHYSQKAVKECRLLIFGGRFHAGMLDGLKKARKIFQENPSVTPVIFAVGAVEETEHAVIEDSWKNNLTEEEYQRIPHFYLPGGLCYEKMPLNDRLMIKVFSFLLKRKKVKSQYETTMLKLMEHSFDRTSREAILPLISCVQEKIIP